MTCYVGIDPGAGRRGGVALYYQGRCAAIPLPETTDGGFKVPDTLEIDSWIWGNELPSPDVFVIEKQKPLIIPVKRDHEGNRQPIKGGIKQSFTAGMNFGVLMQWCGANGRRLIVPPRQWQRAVLVNRDGRSTKEASIEFSRDTLGVDLTPGKRTKPHDGMADAACIAFYGTKFLGDAG